jgi:hypothetical protein
MIRSIVLARKLKAESAGAKSKALSGLQVINLAGGLLVLGWAAYFFLMQSHALWLSPTLIPDRWKAVFSPVSKLFPQEWIRPARSSDLGLLAVGLFVLLLVAFFSLYIVSLRRAFSPGAFEEAEAKPALKRIFAFTLLSLALLFVVPGVLSSDLFSYAWYGRIFVVFGDNPFTHVPADYAWRDGAKWLQWVYWKETPSVYGPVWVLLAGAVAQVSQALGGDIVNDILGHKLLASAAHLANVVLIWKIMGHVVPRYWAPLKAAAGKNWELSAQVGATIAYAWNPLMLLEFGANGHNDIIMVTFVLLAVWLHLAGKWRLAIAALAAATLVKLIAVLFLPGYLWLLFWQAAPGGALDGLPRRIWAGVQALALYVGLWVLFYLPFWEGPATLRPLFTGPPVEMFVNSLGWLARYKLPELVAGIADSLGLQPTEFWTARAVGWRVEWPVRFGATAIAAAVALVVTWRARDFPRMMVAWGWVLFAYLTVGAVWFWPWYVSWLVAVVAVIGPGRLLNATIILSASSLLLYATYWRNSAFLVEALRWRDALIIVPPLAYVLGSSLLESRRHPAQVPDPVPARQDPATRPQPIPVAVPVPIIPERYAQVLRQHSSTADPVHIHWQSAESDDMYEQRDAV